MGWFCSACGHENEDARYACAACDLMRRILLSLVCVKTGKRIEARIETAVGRAILMTIDPEDGKFASELQFSLKRDPSLGWAIQANPSAVNPTLLDRTPLGDAPAKLESGAVVSIGPKLEMKVEMTGL
jgi:hypothetical protein